jgi:hypothetical protein
MQAVQKILMHFFLCLPTCLFKMCLVKPRTIGPLIKPVLGVGSLGPLHAQNVHNHVTQMFLGVTHTFLKIYETSLNPCVMDRCVCI